MTEEKKKLSPEEYYNSLPKRIMAAGGLIMNDKDEVLIVKPSYKDYWEVPGGMTDHGENWHETVTREIHEELNIHVKIKALRCVDLKTGSLGRPDSIQVIFEIEKLSEEQLSSIKVDNDEIIDYGFYPMEKVSSMLHGITALRMNHAFKAAKSGKTFYLTEGENPLDEP